ncbi:MAG: GTPase HflX [Desulfobacterales bacterium]|nr:GTPase HflX [Desulfobacterales bacterium]MDX2512925.1 GTPase HflX [Desulfobacterales bacterium]
MKKLYGNTKGLKTSQVRKIENLYRRKTPPEFIITPELARDISRLSLDINRQIGLLIDRKGKTSYVIVGNHNQIVIPDIPEYRSAPGRLRGVRCVHTHLDNEPLTTDDLTDLALLRLDLMAVVQVGGDGLPKHVLMSHILPKNTGQPTTIPVPLSPGKTDIGCVEMIQSIEEELSRITPLHTAGKNGERALLISVSTASKQDTNDSLDELSELVASSGIQTVGRLLQHRRKIDSRFLMGSGKLKSLVITALQKGATLLVFDQELNPSQIRSITDQIDLKVIDRTQLILDIFAQRAQTREGKLQVELAQLKYLLPRLITKNTAMSRLTGGIGGRGPGETKLEINRRRIRDKIVQLENKLLKVRKQRQQQKARRAKKALPVISIIGYTNAGKSTLLNTLTHSHVLAEKRLFATLDPSSRRLRFPHDTEVIITDTVGFIKDLPEDLLVAFRATLEELESADILLHVIDISNPRHPEQINSVENLLSDLALQQIPLVRVLNKQDLVPAQERDRLSRIYKGFSISARQSSTLRPLIDRLEGMMGR